MRPIVALLTDFGTTDHYVGAMKGAILTVCPEAALVDLGHDVPPHDLLEGALSLVAAASSFPAGAVFLAVVDPGVGTSRRGLAVFAGGYHFVGPDNGVLSLAIEERTPFVAHEIRNAGLFRTTVSPVFHGRDVFGPVAAHLACGAPISEVGPRLDDVVRLTVPPVEVVDAFTRRAVVVRIDRFGNLTTSLTRSDLDSLVAGAPAGAAGFVAQIQDVVLPLVRTYADVAPGEPLALIGSSDLLEIAVHRGSAAHVLRATKGATVVVRRVSASVGGWHL